MSLRFPSSLAGRVFACGLLFIVLLPGHGLFAALRKSRKAEAPSAIDRMIAETGGRTATGSGPGAATGSIYVPGALMAEGFRDLRASRIDDIVTVVVSDRASAISKGTTASQRKSSASGGISSVFGKSITPLSELATMSGDQKLDSQGSTGRESTLTTTLTARVTHVLPNGSLVLEADKEVTVNSERQHVHIRGVIRPFDVSTANTVPSDRLANLEVRVNGNGVVGDAIRRPNILYRILTGLLPF
jgi:flagellar L-ring protein precursor FlgH